ncbi:MAG: winged helix-turn-helix domain-containing protein [Candidatus Jordarchaeaceae archaeon]
MPRLTSGRKRRERHDIIMEILELSRNGIFKTKIMEKAKLSYFQLEEYLVALKKAGFLMERERIWKTTQEGLRVIEACKICHQLTQKVQ